MYLYFNFCFRKNQDNKINLHIRTILTNKPVKSGWLRALRSSQTSRAAGSTSPALSHQVRTLQACPLSHSPCPLSHLQTASSAWSPSRSNRRTTLEAPPACGLRVWENYLLSFNILLARNSLDLKTAYKFKS